jgi:hypothetical protein
VDQGDQFPGNPFHLIGVPAEQGYQFPRNPFHFNSVRVHS